MQKGLKIWFLSYRDWALPVLKTVVQHPSVESVKHINSNKDYVAAISGNTAPDLVILCGWSDEPDQEFVTNVLHIGVHCAEHDKYSYGSPLQNQIIDGLNKTKHRIFKAWFPELSLREYSHEVDLDMSGNMSDILEQMTVTSKALFNMFLDDYPLITWKKWPKSNHVRPRRKPEDSILSKEQLLNMSTKELYNFFRCLEHPYPNGCIEDDEGYLYIERVKWKKKEKYLKFEEYLKKYSKFSDKKKHKLLQKIGIIDSNGKLTPNFGGDKIPDYCVGENCSMCKAQAWHKIEEFTEEIRHPYTTYVCQTCFQEIMTPYKRKE